MRTTRVSKRFLTALGLLLSLTSLSSSLGAWPRISRVQNIRQQLFEHLDEFPYIENAAENVLRYRKHDRQAIEKMMAQYELSLPENELLPELLAEIKRACEIAGVQDAAVNTRAPQVIREIDPTADGAWYRIPFTLSGKAAYRSVALMLDNLSQTDRLIVVREIVMQKSGGTIVFRAQGEAYCRLKGLNKRWIAE